MFLLDRSKITIDDLRSVSQASREARLDQELARFEENLDIMLADKNNFLQDLYRRLKKARSTYKSWNRRTAGGSRATQFVSVEQIEELVDWQHRTQTRQQERKDMLLVEQDAEQPIDMLIRFLQAFRESKELFDQFKTHIFLPLLEFFNDDPQRQFSKALANVIWRWEGLLVPGPINHRLFSPKSADALYYMKTTKPRDSQFNLVLRLVPDLLLKAFEALCLAKQWRSKIGPWGYLRELKYIHSKWIPERHEENTLPVKGARGPRSNFEDGFQGEMNASRTIVIGSTALLTESGTKGVAPGSRYGDAHQRIDHFRNKVNAAYIKRTKQARDLCKLKDHITMLQEEMKNEQKHIQNIRAQLIQGEITSKYSKDKEMTMVLEEELADAFYRCSYLRKEIPKAEQEYSEQMTRYHSTNKRLNFFRQGMDSARSEQLSISTRHLTTREQRTIYEKSLIPSNDNFLLLKEEVKKSKLTRQVFLRQMLQPLTNEHSIG